MKNIFIVFICSLFIVNMQAQQQVSLIEAKNAAVRAIRDRSEQKDYTLSSISASHVLKNFHQDTLLYEIIFSDGKAVILSGSKACLPVLGCYNASKGKSALDTTDMEIPCGLKTFIKEYAEQIALCFNDKSISLSYATEWQNLQNHSMIHSVTSIVVPPLITSKWNQNFSNDGSCDAYNYYAPNSNGICSCAPNGGGGVKCPAGCTAVAMAQIMNYWKYPVYQTDRLEQFDWCNMPDRLYSDNTNYIKERHAIATLLKECGLKANMDYCSNNCSSGASLSDARDALASDFDYDNDADKQTKAYHLNSVWTNRIKDNLNNAWPVLYAGYSSGGGGHAFVCDGYDSDNRFHFNWGWAGDYDGWFALDNLTPSNRDYTSKQEAIFYIRPSINQNYCNYYLPLWAHYYLYYNVQGNTFPPPYLNVPKTFAVLESVHESIAQQLPAPATWHTIPAGGVSEYVAHKEIRLLPGFHAEAGSYFRAHIEPCMGCSEVQSSFIVNNPINEDGFSGIYDMLPPLKRSYSAATDRFSERETASVRLSPNPNSGTFTIETNFDPREVTTVQIYNSLGQLSYSQAGLPQAVITVPGLSKGLFVIKITTATNQFIQKMVVQ